jgi:hypothetical protein
MSKVIDWTEKLPEDVREWASQFSIHHELIRQNDEQFAEDEPETLDDDADVLPYDQWGKPELLAEAGKRELAVPAKVSKPDLVALLQADDDAAEAAANS